LSIIPPPPAGDVRRGPKEGPHGVYDEAIAELTQTLNAPAPSTSPIAPALLAAIAAGLVFVTAAAGWIVVHQRRSTLSVGEDFEAMAFTDALTGVANRRRLDRDLASKSFDDEIVGVLMVDVDHFKAFNDRHGHSVGDEVLRRVGSMLGHEVRHGDVVYRYGGEEFCVLLPGADEKTAAAVAERLRQAARTLSLPVEGMLTVSIGVSIGPSSSTSSTLKVADGALLEAKQSGRDRYCVH
jgi:diguanylate cyclase (GGDEF)-like protein